MNATTGEDIGERTSRIFGELEALRTDEPRLAEPTERAWARIIDLGLWLVGAFVVAGPLAFGVWVLRGRPDEDPALERLVLGNAFLLLTLAYETIGAARGQTLGKRWTQLRIVGPDGGPAGFRRGLIRAAVLVVPIMGAALGTSAFYDSWAWYPFAALGIAGIAATATMLRDNEERGLHDRLAGTTVVTPRD